MPPRNDFNNAGPKPMSGVSHYVVKERPASGQISGHDWRKQGNPPPSNYFKAREMNVNECASYGDYYYPNYNEHYTCNEPVDYFYYTTEYYYDEPNYYVSDQSNYELPPLQQETQAVSLEEPQPSTSFTGEQDFPKSTKSNKLK
jgi:hypothetical protein